MNRNYVVRYDTGEMLNYYKYMMYCPECGHYYDPNMLKTQMSELEPVYCECCGFKMVDIDYEIFDIIKELNEKRYITDYCCEGHYDEIETTIPYISFSGFLSAEDQIMIIKTAISILGDLAHIERRSKYLAIYMEYNFNDNEQEFNKKKSLWLKRMKDVVNSLPYIKGE